MAVQRLRFYGDDGGLKYIDLAKSLSVTERKMKRQKSVFTVYGGYYVDSQGSRININVAPNNWVTKRAINRGFAMWRKMIARTLDNAEAVQPSKYNDFKVFLNSHMGSATLMPVDADNNAINGGEWDYSTLTSEDPDDDATNSPDQFELSIVGQHTSTGSGNNIDYSRVSMMQSWFDSRPQPNDQISPDPAGLEADPLNNLFDAGDTDDDRLAIIASENDAAPYDEDTTWGNSVGNAPSPANLQRVSTGFTVADSIALTPIHGFEALCGLIQLDVQASSAWELVLDVETNGVKF